MNLTVNGEPREIPEGTTLAGLIALLSLSAQHVAIEVNAQVVRRAAHAAHSLHPGDAVEIVTFVGGG